MSSPSNLYSDPRFQNPRSFHSPYDEQLKRQNSPRYDANNDYFHNISPPYQSHLNGNHSLNHHFEPIHNHQLSYSNSRPHHDSNQLHNAENSRNFLNASSGCDSDEKDFHFYLPSHLTDFEDEDEDEKSVEMTKNFSPSSKISPLMGRNNAGPMFDHVSQSNFRYQASSHTVVGSPQRSSPDSWSFSVQQSSFEVSNRNDKIFSMHSEYPIREEKEQEEQEEMLQRMVGSPKKNPEPIVENAEEFMKSVEKASNITFNKHNVTPKSTMSVTRPKESQGHNAISAAVSSVQSSQKNSMDSSLRSNPPPNVSTEVMQRVEDFVISRTAAFSAVKKADPNQSKGNNNANNGAKSDSRKSNHRNRGRNNSTAKKNVEKVDKISLNDLLVSLRDKEGKEKDSNASSQDIQFDRVTWSSSDTQLQPIPVYVKTISGSNIHMQVSMEDSVQVILQSLSEAAETCYVTCFYLTTGGQIKVNDYTSLCEIPKLGPNTTFIMHLDQYDEKSARQHVKRLHEILSINCVVEDNFCLLPHIGADSSETKPVDTSSFTGNEPLPLVSTSLSTYFPKTRSITTCLKNLFFSGWNPPPGNRRLQGDLFYLEIELLEDKKPIFVTACPDGFFVNESNSSTFNPNPSSKWQPSHNLADLLRQVSLGFKENFSGLLSNRYERDPFEIYPVPIPVRPWVGSPKVHQYDLNRSKDFAFVTNNDGQFRDWNEEFQSSKELDQSTVKERIVRDHAIIKVNNDFIDAATRGAVAIINKTVPPLNPMDPKHVRMYIYNNIFFSYAIDTSDKYEEVEGRYTYTSANNDSKGVMSYNNANVEGLYTLATAIIDYRGFRMVAQSMIPGIFNPSTIVFSSTDFCKDEIFSGLLSKASDKLMIPGHLVNDKNGNPVMIHCSSPTKGIVGTDGRRYIIDLCRVTPQDTNWKGNSGVMAILRPELMEILNGENRPGSPLSPDIARDVPFKTVKLNPDVFSTASLAGTPEEIAEAERLVENASAYLVEVIIPNIIQEFNSFTCVPIDGSTLTSLMHHRGINMRYLGTIANQLNGFARELLLREIIVRVSKHILRGILFETSLPFLAPTIASFFNCLFGNGNPPPITPPSASSSSSSNSTAGKKKKKRNSFVGTMAKNPVKAYAFSHTPSSLWSLIKKTALDRFKYEITDEERNNLNEIATLRNLCQKMNIQVAAKEYDFTSDSPFNIEDILDIYPVVKHCNPKSADGHDLLESGVAFLAQGRLDVAFELLSEALVIFSQVYGPMHQATAICFSNMAMVLYQSGDPSEAVLYQHKAVIINERVQGTDHHETAQAYGNLALFCHKTGKVKLALSYIQRALYLGFLACGLSHPDNGTSFTNIGMVLQDLGCIKESLSYFMKALACSEAMAGPDQLLLTAAIYHAIAIDYDLLGDYREALSYEKKNYHTLLKVIGDVKDPRVIEADSLVKEFLSKALGTEISRQLVVRDQ
eukprot:TRINITY_DN4974_c0_g1_i2.p1 TRINITY_DN4974_c0_g1~~TRINITY_DN4974_c0_g1_i2.p1  ORF type:complete len:1454 (+),score=476.66 TRINITY_DN4974_c0_g1_i2:138-4499(+)